MLNLLDFPSSLPCLHQNGAGQGEEMFKVAKQAGI